MKGAVRSASQRSRVLISASGCNPVQKCCDGRQKQMFCRPRCNRKRDRQNRNHQSKIHCAHSGLYGAHDYRTAEQKAQRSHTQQQASISQQIVRASIHGRRLPQHPHQKDLQGNGPDSQRQRNLQHHPAIPGQTKEEGKDRVSLAEHEKNIRLPVRRKEVFTPPDKI